MNVRNLPQRKKLDKRYKEKTGNGSFFVTVVSLKRKPVFGKIENGKVVLSEFGRIIEGVWLELPNYHPQIKLGEFIFMPNHFHGIVHIRELEGKSSISIAQVVHSFKTKSTLDYHKFQKANGVKKYEKLWQRGYIEKWIPRGEALSRIESYIRNNPKK